MAETVHVAVPAANVVVEVEHAVTPPVPLTLQVTVPVGVAPVPEIVAVKVTEVPRPVVPPVVLSVTTLVGVSRVGDAGVTAFEALDGEESWPLASTAVTVKVYEFPGISPVMVSEVPVTPVTS
jgi:hypothetical protein